MWQEFSNMEGAPGKEPNWGTVLEAKALSKTVSIRNNEKIKKSLYIQLLQMDGEKMEE